MTTATGASVAAANTNFLNAVKTLVLSNSSWTLVEDSTVGTSSIRWLAFKCSATGSGMPTDSYVVFISNPNGTLWVLAGEGYNTTTHAITGCPPLPTQSSIAINASGQLSSPPAFTADATTGVPAASGTVLPNVYTAGSVTLNVTTIYWHMFVYSDHLVFGVGTTQAATASYSCYAGGYTSYIPTAATNDPVRIVIAWHNIQISNNYASCSCTREPLQVAGTSRIWPMVVFSRNTANSGNWDIDYTRAGITLSSQTDTYQSAYAVANHLMVAPGNPTSSATTYAQSLRGKFNNSIVSAGAAGITSLAVGDTISYNGTQWAYMGNNWFVDTGSA